MRVMGAKAGSFVFLFDFLKCVLAYSMASLIFDGSGTFFTSAYGANYMPGLLAGLGVFLGHCFPFFMKFRGGKGIASTMGLVVMFDWRVGLIALAVGLSLAFITKYISLGSLFGLLAFALSTIFLGFGLAPSVINCIIAAVGLYKHRGNAMRLFKGKEVKFSVKKRAKSA